MVGEMGLEPVEAVGPLDLRAAKPVVDRGQALELESSGTSLSVAGAANEAGALEHLEVLGDRRLAQRGGLGQFDHTSLARDEALEDRPAGGVGKGREGPAQRIVRSHHPKVI